MEFKEISKIDNHSESNKSNSSKMSGKTNYSYNLSLEKSFIDENLKQNFPVLNDRKECHVYFRSYDFQKNEEYMIDFWGKVIRHIFSITGMQTMKIQKLKELCCMDEILPYGFNNILIELNNREEFITSDQLNNMEWYYKRFDYLNKNRKGGIKSFLSNTVKYLFGYIPLLGSNSNNTNENLNENMFFIKRDSFIKLADEIVLNIIDDLCKINDIRVFTKNEIFENVKRNISSKDTECYNLVLKYLENKFLIKLFNININGIDTICIKRLTAMDEGIDGKDTTIINIHNVILSLEKKLHETDQKIIGFNNTIKEYLKANNRLVSFYLILNREPNKF